MIEDKRRAYNKANRKFRLANLEKCRARNRAYNKTHREQINKRRREFRRENLSMARAKDKRIYQRKKRVS